MMSWLNRKKEHLVTVSPSSASNKMRYHVANLQGLGARAQQEDSFTLMNALDETMYDAYGLMFAVCDGMGGMKDGRLASETAINSLRNSFSMIDIASPIAPQLERFVHKAADDVLNVIGGDGGTTLVLCYILHEQLYFVSTGDSYLFLFRNGKLLRLNEQHTLCRDYYLADIKNGDFDPVSCRSEDESSALTSFLGTSSTVITDGFVKPFQLHKNDLIFACSDGVGGELTEQEMLDALNTPAVTKMCENIDELIKSHASPMQDNYTAIIIKCY